MQKWMKAKTGKIRSNSQPVSTKLESHHNIRITVSIPKQTLYIRMAYSLCYHRKDSPCIYKSLSHHRENLKILICVRIIPHMDRSTSDLARPAKTASHKLLQKQHAAFISHPLGWFLFKGLNFNRILLRILLTK